MENARKTAWMRKKLFSARKIFNYKRRKVIKIIELLRDFFLEFCLTIKNSMRGKFKYREKNVSAKLSFALLTIKDNKKQLFGFYLTIQQLLKTIFISENYAVFQPFGKTNEVVYLLLLFSYIWQRKYCVYLFFC